ncbi:MAG: outer membrane beta-barrel protein [Bacteroidetes bacterium]|jgi:hypothetical protein|nr:outer membrane beta-barrel protein [Bacteroidota bacterium]
MKHLLLPIVLLCAGLTALQAQSAFSFGPVAGVNAGSFRWIDPPNFAEEEGFQFKPGWQAGLHLTYQFTDQLSLSTQPMFVRRGSSSGEESVNVRIDYFDLPLLLRVNATEALFVEAGGYVGFRLDSRRFNEDGEYAEYSQENYDVLHRDVDAGALLGLGYRLGERASLSLRYSHSVVNLYENIIFTDMNGEAMGDQPKLLQQSVQLLFAYSL